jgi:hypothetical protein
VIVCSDHSQSQVEQEIDLFTAFEEWEVLPASGTGEAEIALCPSSRSAQVYLLEPRRRQRAIKRVEDRLLEVEGVDLVLSLTDHPDGEARVRSERGELRFAPRGDLSDARGERWSIEGDLEVLALRVEDEQIKDPLYPDALARAWSALRCSTTGDVLVSAAPGFEFLDWGRAHHVGGGSHGSLHAVDSHGSLIWCGTGPDSADACPQWTLRDIVPMVKDHFGLAEG